MGKETNSDITDLPVLGEEAPENYSKKFKILTAKKFLLGLKIVLVI